MQYLLGGRAGEAVERFSQLRRAENAGAWADSALTGMLGAIPKMDDLAACYGLIEAEGRKGDGAAGEIERAARARMDELVRGDLTFEKAGAFLSSWPETPWTADVRKQLDEKARETYLKGRVYEGLHEYQEALDAYYAILTLAPDSSAGKDAQDAVERIQTLAEES